MAKRMMCWMFLIAVLLVGTANADLVVYYSFDGIEGDTVNDLSGSGNDGTLEDGPSIVAGQMGDALAFDNTRVAIPISDSLTGDMFQTSFTVVAWINPTLTGNTWQQILRAQPQAPGTDTLFINNDGRLSWRGYVDGGWAGGMCETAPGVAPADQWTHFAVTGDGTNFRIFINGVLSVESAFQMTGGGNDTYYIGGTAGGESYAGAVDEFGIFTEALEEADIQAAMSGLGKKGLASKPIPENELSDTLRDTILSWTPGKFAQTHNVYLGTVFDDVNDADVANPLGVLASQGQTADSYDAGIFEFGQTYYWRVDEVNGAPDNTVYKGEVWSFDVEPFSIPVETLTVTASSSHADNMGPENTIGGMGLNELDQHSTEGTTMWLSGMGDATPSLQYEFDKAYKLDELLVWNSNQLIEAFVGLGAKDVMIEYSTDGIEWMTLENTPEFAQATGSSTYTANTAVDFGGVMAKFVKITINAGYGMLPQYGISEVRFLYIPTFAREAQPADGAITDAANVMLSWRAGREGASHQVNLGTDAETLDLVATTTEPSYAADGLDYGTTYYWSITEVNEAATPASHAGDIWSFTTPDFGTVDSFDSYDDNCNRIFFAWEDGLGHNGGETIDDCDVPASNGNGGGSIVGNAQAPFAERGIVHSGSQSMPLEYDNAFGPSEAVLSIDGQDWTASGVQTLSLYFYGQADNSGQLYVKINNSKVAYDGEAGDIGKAQWLPWNIDLSAISGLQSVNSLTIGIDGASAAGMLYIDSIRLYPQAVEFITPTEPDAANLVALYAFEGDYTDSVGGHNATAMGMPQIVSDPVRGQVLSVAGGGDYLDVPHSAALNPTEFTASLWAQVNPNGSGHRSPLTSRDDGPQRGYIIYVEPGNTWQFWTGTGSAWNNTAGPAVVMDEWTHVGITFANDQKTLYINGRVAAEGTGALGLNTAQPLRIGGGASEDPNGQFFFVGLIDDIRIYNQALSPAELAWLADIRTPMPKPL